MKPDVIKRYICFPASKEIWDSLKTTYSDENDEVHVYSLNQKAYRLCQDGRPLAIYFGELTENFHELDQCSKDDLNSEKKIKAYSKSIERQRVYVFLGGLDDVLDQVRGEVLRKDHPLGFQASYAYIRREVERKETMKVDVDKTEPTAMSTQARTLQHRFLRSNLDNKPRYNRTNINGRDKIISSGDSHYRTAKCPHCGLTRHLKSRCFELIGYPENWDKTRDPRYNKSRAQIVETSNDYALVTGTCKDGHPNEGDDWLWY